MEEPEDREAKDLAPTVRAAQAGDPRAFEALAERFREPLRAYAFSLLRDSGYAEDATQETLLLAWRRLGSLRRPVYFRQWLYAILENAALSGFRFRRRRGPSITLRGGEAVAEGDGLPGEEPPPPAPDRPEVEALRSSLAALPETQRDVLSRHYLEGLSSQELARAIGVPVNTAKVRLYRARIALRRELLARGVGEAAVGAPGREP